MGDKKILHVLYSGLGGHGNVFFSFVEADVKKEFGYEAMFNGIEDVKTEYITKCVEHKIPWHFVKKKEGLDFGYYAKMYRIIKNSNASIIFLHNSGYILPAWLATLFNRKKRKIIVRDTQSNQLKTRLEWIWLALALMMSHKIVFLSKEYNEEVRKSLKWFFREKKISIIPNGISLDLFTPGVNAPASTLNIGMQSRIVSIKDHKTLLRAFALVRNNKGHAGKILKLKIAGVGEYQSTLQKLAMDLGITDDIEFTGLLNEKELVQFLQSLLIYIHASLGETMSTAIMQAMACKLPVIASDVKGIRNMISDNINGLLVPPENPEKMAEAIEQLLNDKKNADCMAEAGYATAVEKFSSDRMFRSYITLFNELFSEI